MRRLLLLLLLPLLLAGCDNSFKNTDVTGADYAKDFKVFYQKVPGKTPGTYTMDHSAGSFVYDPQGRLRLFVRHAPPQEDPTQSIDRLAGDIKLLLSGK